MKQKFSRYKGNKTREIIVMINGYHFVRFSYLEMESELCDKASELLFLGSDHGNARKWSIKRSAHLKHSSKLLHRIPNEKVPKCSDFFFS